MRRLVPAAACALLSSLLAVVRAPAQGAPHVFTHADTLRGSNTPQRAWWDVAFYDLHVRIDPADSSIVGWNAISYHILASSASAGREMQIDLQTPLEVDSMRQEGKAIRYRPAIIRKS